MRRRRPTAPLAVLVVLAALPACAEPEAQGPPSFAYGEFADVTVPVSDGRVPLRATVRLVQRVTLAELVRGGIRGDLGDTQPYYVRVSYANTSGRAFVTPVDGQFRPRQSDGEYAERVDVVSEEPFEPCQDPTPPPSFALLDAAADACLIVLASPGTVISSVEWTFSDRTTEAVWRPAAD